MELGHVRSAVMGEPLLFPRFKLTDVAASLRTLAAQIESGDRPVTRAVVCMETEDGGFDYCAIGADFSRAHALGLLRFCEHEIVG